MDNLQVLISSLRSLDEHMGRVSTLMAVQSSRDIQHHAMELSGARQKVASWIDGIQADIDG